MIAESLIENNEMFAFRVYQGHDRCVEHDDRVVRVS